MRIEWSPDAVSDLKLISEYVEQDRSLETANRVVGGGEKVSHFGGRKGATSVVTQWTLGERLGTELNYDLHRKPILVARGNSTSCPAATVLSTVPPWRSH